jgi:hypothetical protein
VVQVVPCQTVTSPCRSMICGDFVLGVDDFRDGFKNLRNSNFD